MDWISYYVKGLMKTDSDGVLDAEKALREDHQLEERLKESMEELENLRVELSSLKESLKEADRETQASDAKAY